MVRAIWTIYWGKIYLQFKLKRCFEIACISNFIISYCEFIIRFDLNRWLFILKFTEPLHSCCCPVQKYLPRMAKLARQLSRGSVNFKINSRPIFTIIFQLKNDNFKTRDFSPPIERILACVHLSNALNALSFYNLKSNSKSILFLI